MVIIYLQNKNIFGVHGATRKRIVRILTSYEKQQIISCETSEMENNSVNDVYTGRSLLGMAYTIGISVI